MAQQTTVRLKLRHFPVSPAYQPPPSDFGLASFAVRRANSLKYIFICTHTHPIISVSLENSDEYKSQETGLKKVRGGWVKKLKTRVFYMSQEGIFQSER